MNKINFENPGDMSQISYADVYKQLLPLRDNPEEFNRVARNLFNTLIAQMGGKESLKELQANVDEAMAHTSNPMATLGEMMGESIHSLAGKIADLFSAKRAEKELVEEARDAVIH